MSAEISRESFGDAISVVIGGLDTEMWYQCYFDLVADLLNYSNVVDVIVVSSSLNIEAHELRGKEYTMQAWRLKEFFA